MAAQCPYKIMINNHNRRSIRLPGFDYTSEGGYYVTIVSHSRLPIFGTIDQGKMQLSDFGKIVRKEWYKTATIRKSVELIPDEFIVMPNHIHGIIWIMNNDNVGSRRRLDPVDDKQNISKFGKPISGSISTIVGSFKSVVTRRINLQRGTPGSSVWQRGYYEHILRDDGEYDNLVEYIMTNPERWGEDKENR